MDAGATTPAGAPVSLGPADRIPPGEGRVYLVAGRRVAVFRPREGGLFATRADCPHRRGPLSDGLLGGGVVVCPLHAFRFQLATGAPVGNDCAALATYPVALGPDGDILLSPGVAGAGA
jgi:nitrite reductase/ring-hydroxylating ferredoxin subunit